MYILFTLVHIFINFSYVHISFESHFLSHLLFPTFLPSDTYFLYIHVSSTSTFSPYFPFPSRFPGSVLTFISPTLTSNQPLRRRHQQTSWLYRESCLYCESWLKTRLYFSLSLTSFFLFLSLSFNMCVKACAFHIAFSLVYSTQTHRIFYLSHYLMFIPLRFLCFTPFFSVSTRYILSVLLCLPPHVHSLFTSSSSPLSLNVSFPVPHHFWTSFSLFPSFPLW